MFDKTSLEGIRAGNNILDDSQTNDMRRIIEAFETEGIDITMHKLCEVAEREARTLYQR